jgi:hypothetical protein
MDIERIVKYAMKERAKTTGLRIDAKPVIARALDEVGNAVSKSLWGAATSELVRILREAEDAEHERLGLPIYAGKEHVDKAYKALMERNGTE